MGKSPKMSFEDILRGESESTFATAADTEEKINPFGSKIRNSVRERIGYFQNQEALATSQGHSNQWACNDCEDLKRKMARQRLLAHFEAKYPSKSHPWAFYWLKCVIMKALEVEALGRFENTQKSESCVNLGMLELEKTVPVLEDSTETLEGAMTSPQHLHDELADSQSSLKTGVAEPVPDLQNAALPVAKEADLTTLHDTIDKDNRIAAYQNQLEQEAGIPPVIDLEDEATRPVLPSFAQDHVESQLTSMYGLADDMPTAFDTEQNNNSAVALPHNNPTSLTNGTAATPAELLSLFALGNGMIDPPLLPHELPLEEREDVRPAQPSAIAAYAKLVFTDGTFFMSTPAVILGRDVPAHKAALARDNAKMERRSDYATPRRKTSKHSRSVVSESGGIIRQGLDFEPKKKSEKKSRKSESSNSSAQRRGSVNQPPVGPVEYLPQVDISARHYVPDSAAAVAVDPEELRPSSNHIPLISVHPPADLPASAHKSISRQHIKIYHNNRKNCWEAEIMGRNGAFIDDRFFFGGDTAPIRHNSNVLIGVVSFDFILPEIATSNGSADIDNIVEVHGLGVSTDFEARRMSSGSYSSMSERSSLSPNPNLQQAMASSIEYSDDEDGFPPPKPHRSRDVQVTNGNGRHSRDQIEEASNLGADSAAEEPAKPVKRGRGRPPKNGQKSQREMKDELRMEKERAKREAEAARLAEEDQDQAESSQQQEQQQPVKRGPGRPRKNPLPAEDHANPTVKKERKPYTRKDKDPNAEPKKGKKADREESPEPTPEPHLGKEKSDFTDAQLQRPAGNYVDLLVQVFRDEPLVGEERLRPSLVLSQLYRRLKRKWPYFKFIAGMEGKDGWTSSVRHNLGQNDCFQKHEKAGKGFSWLFDEEIYALNRKGVRRHSPKNDQNRQNQPIFAGPSQPNLGQTHNPMPYQPGFPPGQPPAMGYHPNQGYPSNGYAQPSFQNPHTFPPGPGYGPSAQVFHSLHGQAQTQGPPIPYGTHSMHAPYNLQNGQTGQFTPHPQGGAAALLQKAPNPSYRSPYPPKRPDEPGFQSGPPNAYGSGVSPHQSGLRYSAAPGPSTSQPALSNSSAHGSLQATPSTLSKNGARPGQAESSLSQSQQSGQNPHVVPVVMKVTEVWKTEIRQSVDQRLVNSLTAGSVINKSIRTVLSVTNAEIESFSSKIDAATADEAFEYIVRQAVMKSLNRVSKVKQCSNDDADLRLLGVELINSLREALGEFPEGLESIIWADRPSTSLPRHGTAPRALSHPQSSTAIHGDMNQAQQVNDTVMEEARHDVSKLKRTNPDGDNDDANDRAAKRVALGSDKKTFKPWTAKHSSSPEVEGKGKGRARD